MGGGGDANTHNSCSRVYQRLSVTATAWLEQGMMLANVALITTPVSVIILHKVYNNDHHMGTFWVVYLSAIVCCLPCLLCLACKYTMQHVLHINNTAEQGARRTIALTSCCHA